MASCFRFNEFELDVGAYVLRRGGERIRLEKIPMEVLTLLVEQAGALVDRPTIHEALWGADVFVERDAAINTAIRKVRRALGDDAEQPRLIETIVGKGYRFLAPVKRSGGRGNRPPWSNRGRALAAARRDVRPGAYAAYVRGRHAWEKRGEPHLRDAIGLFQQSIDADPTYAPAYAGLSDCYGQLGYGSYIAPDDAFPRGSAAARKALELDPALAEAHASLAFALMYYGWDFAAAETEFKRAIELNPNYAIAHQWYAYLLTAMDRPLSDADGEISKAKSLDPLSVPIQTDRTYLLHYYGKDDEALRSIRVALEMNPKFPLAHFWLGRIYTNQGRYADAEAAFRNIGPLRTWTPAMAALGYAYAKAGRPADAVAILAEFRELARREKYASAYAVAIIYAGLGDREQAFSMLDTAVRERSHWLVWLNRDPRWNDIRSDARFQALVREVGLPS